MPIPVCRPLYVNEYVWFFFVCVCLSLCFCVCFYVCVLSLWSCDGVRVPVCLHVCLPVHLSFRASRFHTSICLSIPSSVCLHIRVSSAGLDVWTLHVCLYVCMSVCTSVHMSVCMYMCTVNTYISKNCTSVALKLQNCECELLVKLHVTAQKNYLKKLYAKNCKNFIFPHLFVYDLLGNFLPFFNGF